MNTVPRSGAEARQAMLAGAALLAFAAVLLLVNADGTLINSDDCLYATIIREMTSSGDWGRLTWQGIPYVNKPPLFFWLGGLATTAFGESDLALRLPAIAGAWVTVALVFLLAWRWSRNVWVAVTVGVWLLGSKVFFDVSRRVLVDVPLGAAVLLAATLIFLWEHKRWVWALAGASVGAALLLKSLGALPLLLTPALWFGIAALRRRQPLNIAVGLAGAALVVVPVLLASSSLWLTSAAKSAEYYASAEPTQFSHGAGFFVDVIWQTEPWYLVATLIGLVATSLLAWRRRDANMGFVVVYSLVPMVVWSAVSVKLPHYVTGAFPGFALAMFAPLTVVANWRRFLGPVMLGVAVLVAVVAQMPHLVGNPQFTDTSRDLKQLAEKVRQAPPEARFFVTDTYFLAPQHYSARHATMIVNSERGYTLLNAVKEFSESRSIVRWDLDQIADELRVASVPTYLLLKRVTWESLSPRVPSVKAVGSAGDFVLVATHGS